MPISGTKKRTYQREYMRRYRAEKRAAKRPSERRIECARDGCGVSWVESERQKNAKYCSQKCFGSVVLQRKRDQTLSARPLRICLSCGHAIPAEKRSNSKYCSRTCAKREERRRYMASHPQSKRDQNMRFRQSESGKASILKYESRPDVKAMRRAYRRENRHRYNTGRRNLQANQLGNVSAGIKRRLWSSQGQKCAHPWCGKKVSLRQSHLDHIIPLGLGGLHDDDNFQVLCAPCNQSKSATHPSVVAQRNGYLFFEQGKEALGFTLIALVRTCRHCGATITNRNYRAKQCETCAIKKPRTSKPRSCLRCDVDITGQKTKRCGPCRELHVKEQSILLEKRKWERTRTDAGYLNRRLKMRRDSKRRRKEKISNRGIETPTTLSYAVGSARF